MAVNVPKNTSQDAGRLRAWWAFRQGLDGSLQRTKPSEVISRSGWMRSVGGSSPYLSLFARAGLSRESIDASVARGDIHELPAARGCTYVVPAADYRLALSAASAQMAAAGDWKTAEKLGVPAKEIAQLCQKTLRALEKEPLDPEGLRKALGPAVRNLGEEGKKKGLTTTLPVALERLQAEGEIRRIPSNGRLDQQRYAYTLWRPSPMSGARLGPDEVFANLAQRFFRWIGPARLAEFQAFAGCTVKQAKAAVEGLKLEPIGPGDDRLLPGEDRAAFEDFEAPREPQTMLLSSLDSLFLLRRDLASLLSAEDVQNPFLAAGASRALIKDLPSHAIVDRGRLIGLWEYDPGSEQIAWTAWVKRTKQLEAAVARMREFVADQLGDARSFSLDSPQSRAPRLAALRKSATV